ncbi:MAG: hypothetical protein ACI8UZ_001711 [Akkermansiaceae bacterium]|jgi:hypothetical protein
MEKKAIAEPFKGITANGKVETLGEPKLPQRSILTPPSAPRMVTTTEKTSSSNISKTTTTRLITERVSDLKVSSA